jgi:hypothetical protein
VVPSNIARAAAGSSGLTSSSMPGDGGDALGRGHVAAGR